MVRGLKDILLEQGLHNTQLQSKWDQLSIEMPTLNIQKLLRQTPKNTQPIWANLMA